MLGGLGRQSLANRRVLAIAAAVVGLMVWGGHSNASVAA